MKLDLIFSPMEHQYSPVGGIRRVSVDKSAYGALPLYKSMAGKAILRAMPPAVADKRIGSRAFAFERSNHRALEAPQIEQITTYDDFRRALNQRRVALGMSMLDLDARSGLADGYSSKILGAAPAAHGRYHRNIGPVALDCLLPALRVRLRLEPIDD